MSFRTNCIYCGDCLFVLEHDIKPDSIDLIYLDPPFFTGAVQKGKWAPEAMEISFEDSKKFWESKRYVGAPEWMKFIGIKQPAFASYLYYMKERLELCKKVLKNTGSIYLHCDSRASHYLKMVMDEIFEDHFQNEIIWHYAKQGGVKKYSLPKAHETIFYYTKGDKPTWKPPKKPYSEKLLKTLKKDEKGWYYTRGTRTGRREIADWEKEKRVGLKTYVDLEHGGTLCDTVWNDVGNYPRADESLGYPTQKPESLMERIIEASSNLTDIVLDPFCGCGTTIVVAHDSGRRWIGIDVNLDACKVMQHRFEKQFGFSPPVHYRHLDAVLKIKTGYEFETWVNDFFDATKPSPDLGIDGITKDGVAIQSKTHMVSYDIVSSLVSNAQYHPKVPKPIKTVILVSQKGFDDKARARAFEIGQKDGIKVQLYEPKDLLSQ